MAKGAITKSVTGRGKKGAATKSFQKKPSERKEEGGGALVKSIPTPGATPSTSAIVRFSPTITGNPETKVASVSGGDPKLARVEKIRVSVVNIESYFKTRLKSKRDNAKKSTKARERTKGQQQEKEDEKGAKKLKPKGKSGLKLPKPKGIFERIMSTFMSIIGMALVMRLMPYMDKLKPVLTFAVGALTFISEWIGKILNGLVTFISWGMDAYDATVGWIGDTFGEDALNAVEQISGALVNLINAAIIVGSAMLAMDMNPFDRGKGLKKPSTGPKPTKPLVNKPGIKPTGRVGGARLVQTKHGHAAANIYQNAIDNGKSPKAAKAAVDKALKKGQIVSKPQTGSLGGTDKGSKIAKGGLKKVPKRLATKVLGKQGIMAMKGIAKGFSRIPIVGPLIVGVSSLLAGEGIGKALFKAFGAALGGFLGTFIPIPVLGTILGEMVGTYVGDLVHTLIMGGGIGALGERLKKDIGAALNVAGAAFNFIKDGAVRFFENFPTVDVPDIRPGKIFADMLSINPIFKAMMEFEVKLPSGPFGSIHKALDMIPLMPKEWKTALKEGFSLKGILDALPGVQEILGTFAQFIPGMDKHIKDGALKKVPNLLLLTPFGLPFLLPHVGKSFLPGVFGGSSTKPNTPPKKTPPAESKGEKDQTSTDKDGPGFFQKAGDMFGGLMSGIGNMFGGGKDNTTAAVSDGIGNTGPTGPNKKIISGGNVKGTNEEKWKAFYGMAQIAGAAYPQLLAAQFALESAWGTALSAKNNFFGIKATSSESATVSNTREVINGQSVYMDERFKNFDTPQDAVNHLVTQWYKDYKGYKGVNNAASAFAAADQLRKEGYATDPQYASSLKRLMNEYSGVTGDQKDVDSLQVTPTEMADAGDVTPPTAGTFTAPPTQTAPASSDSSSSGSGGASGGGSQSTTGGPTPTAGGFSPAPSLKPGQNAAAISQMTDYEKISSGMKSPSSMFMPIPIGGPGTGGRGPMGGGGGGSTLFPKGLNKKESIEAFYKAQLLGFLQRQ